MRIGVFFKHDAWNVIYRAVAPLDALGARGYETRLVVQQPDGRFDAAPLFECDVVHIYRRGDPPLRATVDRLRRLGIAIVWDNDDDMRLVPKEAPARARISHYKAQQNFQAGMDMVRRADVVTTTSKVLADSYGAGTTPVTIVENYLSAWQYAPHATPQETVVIGWVAGQEHVADSRRLDVTGLMQRALARHEHLRVVTVGVRLQLDDPRYVHHNRIPIVELKNHTRRFDIAIAPLADMPMSYARSNIKVKEYAAVGAPWLASARGPYENLGPSNGGLLVRDDEWGEALDRLISSPAERLRLNRHASAWAKTQLIDRHIDKWIAVYEQAIASARQRANTSMPVSFSRRSAPGAL